MNGVRCDTCLFPSLAAELAKFGAYRRMYRSLRFMNASSIVNEYLGLEEATPLPFSLAHGVWPYGVKYAQNCTDVEPWHWSFNEHIHESVEIKNSILLPHPWLLLASLSPCKDGQRNSGNAGGSLLVGLPPSSTNDNILYESIRKKNIDAHAILVKPRGPGFKASMAFWGEKSIKPLVARSYRDLYQILGNYASICCPNFSSIIFFAAAIGLNVRLLRDVPLYGYESPIDEVWCNDWISSQKIGWAKIAALCSSPLEIRKESLDTLGIKYLLPPAQLADKILEQIARERLLGRRALRLIPGRTRLQAKLHDLLAIGRLSFPSLYKDGFRRVITDRILTKILASARAPVLARIKFPSIDDELAGRSPQEISRHAASLSIQAGFGASI